jgi:phosphopantothenoylcysteine decarboxylase/phosphopantothenate--cysteine ligase
MAEPEQITEFIKKFFRASQSLIGKKALVTAGPTYESIDPVRFIGNHSTGKMGYLVAEELASRGAMVTLVSGPSNQKVNNPNINLQQVITADEMFRESTKVFSDADIIVLSAAVADYKPKERATEKIKKNNKSMILELTKTIDIAESLGKTKRNEQFIVGFALETEHELENARQKIKKKNFDLIVLNSLNDEGAGFGYDTNKVTIIDKKGVVKAFGLKSKKEVAVDIINEIADRIHA